MLASLTGLLLTLGGDQPAVVFDPPLDPSIFDWDGKTLRVKPELLPYEQTFPLPIEPFDTNQKIIFNSDVQTFIPGWHFDFNAGFLIFLD